MDKKRYFPRIFPIILMVCAVSARIIPGPRTIDDAYITFRYARNILAGYGFVYNPGEHVLGTTTPLYTILLVVAGFFSGGNEANFPLIAMILNAFFDAISCWLLYLIGTKLERPISAIVCAFVWMFSPYSVTFAIGGLETSLFVLIIIATMYAYLNFNFNLTALLLALAVLLRPDALILTLLIGLDRIQMYWKELHNVANSEWLHKAFQEFLIFSLPVFSWILFAFFYFGNPLPHSMMAKTLAYHLPPYSALVRFFQHFAAPFQEDQLFGFRWLYWGMLINPFLYIVGSKFSIKVNIKSLPFLIYPWLYFIVFSLANPLVFRWYLTPPLPIYILMIIIGFENLLNKILVFLFLNYKHHIQTIKQQILPIATFLFTCAIPFVCLINSWIISPDHGLDRPAPKMAWYQLELLYQEAAKVINDKNQNQQKNMILAAGDVGVLGYYTNTKILDTVGLNSPISLSYYPLDASYYAINYAIPPNLILDVEPEYLVILEVYGRNGLLINTTFQKKYKLIKTIPTDIYGSHGMLIFEHLGI